MVTGCIVVVGFVGTLLDIHGITSINGYHSCDVVIASVKSNCLSTTLPNQSVVIARKYRVGDRSEWKAVKVAA